MKKVIDKIRMIENHLEQDFKSGDPFAFWVAVYSYTYLETEARAKANVENFSVMPKWVLDELQRISSELIELEGPEVLNSISSSHYADVLQKILNVNGHKRRSAVKKRDEAGIRIEIRKLLPEGNRRIDDLDTLGKKINSNRRQIEALYDKTKKKYLLDQQKQIAEMKNKIAEIDKEIALLSKETH